jgi:hypothetical protein
MESVIASDPGPVAVGYDSSLGETGAAVCTSSDGLVWSRVPDDEMALGGTGDQVTSSVVEGGPGLIAAVWHWTPDQ